MNRAHFKRAFLFVAMMFHSVHGSANSSHAEDLQDDEQSDGLASNEAEGFLILTKVRTTRQSVFQAPTDEERKARLENTVVVVQCAKSILDKIQRDNLFGITSLTKDLTQSEQESRKIEAEKQAAFIVQGLIAKKGEKKHLKDECTQLYGYFVSEISKLNDEIIALRKEKGRYEAICKDEKDLEARLRSEDEASSISAELKTQMQATGTVMEASRIELAGIRARKSSTLTIKQACEDRILKLGDQLVEKGQLLSTLKQELVKAKNQENDLQDLIALIDEAMLCIGGTVPGVIAPVVVKESSKEFKEYATSHAQNPLYKEYFPDDSSPYPPVKAKGTCLLL